MSDNEDSGSDKEVKDEKEEKEEKEEGGGGKIEGKKFVIKKWHAVTLWTWGTFSFVIISRKSRPRTTALSARSASASCSSSLLFLPCWPRFDGVD